MVIGFTVHLVCAVRETRIRWVESESGCHCERIFERFSVRLCELNKLHVGHVPSALRVVHENVSFDFYNCVYRFSSNIYVIYDCLVFGADGRCNTERH